MTTFHLRTGTSAAPAFAFALRRPAPFHGTPRRATPSRIT